MTHVVPPERGRTGQPREDAQGDSGLSSRSLLRMLTEREDSRLSHAGEDMGKHETPALWRRVVASAVALVGAVMSPVMTSQTSAATFGTINMVYGQGFDTCETLTGADLSAWWTGTPNYSVGLYLGGQNGTDVGCTFMGRTVWDDASTIGYGIEPFWYGDQMPTSCGGSSRFTDFITLNDSQASYSEGQTVADHAVSAAESLGLGSGAPIYLDLEGFANNAGCVAAAESYVSGWDNYMLASSYQGDLYGSSCSSYLTDMASLGVPPGAIAPSDPGTSVTGVYNLLCLSNSDWDRTQRIHQTEIGTSHTFNGVTLTVDQDCADGPETAGVNNSPNASSCGSPY